jgi:hypothetical protein
MLIGGRFVKSSKEFKVVKTPRHDIFVLRIGWEKQHHGKDKSHEYEC